MYQYVYRLQPSQSLSGYPLHCVRFYVGAIDTIKPYAFGCSLWCVFHRHVECVLVRDRRVYPASSVVHSLRANTSVSACTSREQIQRKNTQRPIQKIAQSEVSRALLYIHKSLWLNIADSCLYIRLYNLIKWQNPTSTFINIQGKFYTVGKAKRTAGNHQENWCQSALFPIKSAP